MGARWITAPVLLAALATVSQAAVDTTLIVSASGTASPAGSGYTFTAKGTATLAGFGNAVLTLDGQVAAAQAGAFTEPVKGTFKIDYSGGHTLSGTFSIPAGIFIPLNNADATGSGSLTITAGTGAFEGTTGSFPAVTGSGTATSPISSNFGFSGKGSLNLGPLAAPAPIISGAVNSASGDTRLSPGCLATVSGTNLKGQSTSIKVSGKAVGLLNAAATSLAIQIPVDLATGAAELTEQRDGLTSNTFQITLDSFAPAILPAAAGIGSFFHMDGSTVTAVDPAAAGETIRAAATCLGATNPPIPTGAKPPQGVNAITVIQPGVTVGNQLAKVTASIAEPNQVGIYDVYFTVPGSSASGNQPVVLSAVDKNSKAAQLPVGPAVPVITGVVNGASFGSLGTIAAGEFATVFGANFGDQDTLEGFPATSFNGLSVSFNGVLAPFFALLGSAGQINLVTPSELAESGSVTVVIKNQLGASRTYSGRLVAASPGISVIPDPSNTERRNAAALFANTAWRVVPPSMAMAFGWPTDCRSAVISAGSVCGESATAGDDIEIFTTGLGKATPGGDPSAAPLATGAIAPADGSILYQTVQKPPSLSAACPWMFSSVGSRPGARDCIR